MDSPTLHDQIPPSIHRQYDPIMQGPGLPIKTLEIPLPSSPAFTRRANPPQTPLSSSSISKEQQPSLTPTVTVTADLTQSTPWSDPKTHELRLQPLLSLRRAAALLAEWREQLWLAPATFAYFPI